MNYLQISYVNQCVHLCSAFVDMMPFDFDNKADKDGPFFISRSLHLRNMQSHHHDQTSQHNYRPTNHFTHAQQSVLNYIGCSWSHRPTNAMPVQCILRLRRKLAWERLLLNWHPLALHWKTRQQSLLGCKGRSIICRSVDIWIINIFHWNRFINGWYCQLLLPPQLLPTKPACNSFGIFEAPCCSNYMELGC